MTLATKNVGLAQAPLSCSEVLALIVELRASRTTIQTLGVVAGWALSEVEEYIRDEYEGTSGFEWRMAELEAKRSLLNAISTEGK